METILNTYDGRPDVNQWYTYDISMTTIDYPYQPWNFNQCGTHHMTAEAAASSAGIVPQYDSTQSRGGNRWFWRSKTPQVTYIDGFDPVPHPSPRPQHLHVITGLIGNKE